MQKITGKLKNTPRGVQSHLASCSVSPSLNKEDTLSVMGKVRPVINPEGVQHRKVEHSLLVFVQNKDGFSLMPCSVRKARLLLKEKKALVIKKYPFTIRLVFGSSGYKQKVILGVDSGFENIGFSAISETKELISGTVKLDGKTSERLQERAMYRRGEKKQIMV